MKYDVVVPEVGESITSGLLTVWLKADGEAVVEGDDLFELDTEKTTLAVPATVTGVLKILVPADTEIQIGQVVAEIDGDAAAIKDSTTSEPAKTSDSTPKQTASEPEKVLSPAVKRVVAEHGLDVAALPASGPKGNIVKEDALHAVAQQSRRIAQQGQRIAQQGQHIAQQNQQSPQPKPEAQPSVLVASSPPPTTVSEAQTRVKMSLIRKKTAEKLVQAQRTAAHLTTFNEVDMNAVMMLRSGYKDDFEQHAGVRLGFMSFFIKAAQQALTAYPGINAFIEGDEIVYNTTYNIGVAMSTEKGLLTPVIREVEKKSFAEIEQAIIGFRDKALTKKLLPQELMGGTFTITNGGVFGSLLSTPIPNPPQSGILAMHTIQKRPVVVQDDIIIRPMMYLALTYDHRIVDGREAIGFLIHIKRLIEDPNKLLLGI